MTGAGGQGAAPARVPRHRWWVLGTTGLVAITSVVVVAAVVSGAVGQGPLADSDPTTAPVPSPTPALSSEPVTTGAPPAPSPTPAVSTQAETETDATAALRLLDEIPTVEGFVDGYDRESFGWRTDVDRNGCDTRNDILGRDLLDPVFKPGTGDCKVLSGTLIDPYDGRRVEFESGWDTSVLVQIDHVVALGWAWHRGAFAWDVDTRVAFANDPRNLVASSGETNQEKSAYGPSEWLPAVPELRCEYVVKWVGVLTEYGLGIDSADRRAAEAVLQGC